MIRKPRILLINPWIHDFAAFNLWARPLGLLKVAEYLSGFDVELLFIDCTNLFGPNQYGVGKYRAEPIKKPEMLRSVPRYYKRYGMSVDEFSMRLKSVLPFDIVLMTSIMSYWYPGAQEAIRLVKETAGDIPIVLGGIYPTLYPDHASRNSGADSIYTGPLNDRLLLILRSFDLALRPAHEPEPYYKLNLYPCHPFSPLLTSTGCPFRCSYCASGFLSSAHERRPADDLIREIRALCDGSPGLRLLRRCASV